jgi:hypothetical protein
MFKQHRTGSECCLAGMFHGQPLEVVGSRPTSHGKATFLPFNSALTCGPQPSASTEPPYMPKSMSAPRPTSQLLWLDEARVKKVYGCFRIFTCNSIRCLKLKNSYFFIYISNFQVLYMPNQKKM